MIHYPTLTTLRNFMISQGLSTANFPMLETPADLDIEVAEGLDLAYPQASIFREILEIDAGAGRAFYRTPELILGDRAQQVIGFWRDIEIMAENTVLIDEIWDDIDTSAPLALMPAYARVTKLAGEMFPEHWPIIADAVERFVLSHAGDMSVAVVAVRATAEILVADELQEFTFLPFFGIDDPCEIPASLPTDSSYAYA